MFSPNRTLGIRVSKFFNAPGFAPTVRVDCRFALSASKQPFTVPDELALRIRLDRHADEYRLASR